MPFQPEGFAGNPVPPSGGSGVRVYGTFQEKMGAEAVAAIRTQNAILQEILTAIERTNQLLVAMAATPVALSTATPIPGKKR